MAINDTLGDRIKRYERVFNQTLVPRSPVFIRIDGKSFHTFTRGCDKPFDQVLIDAMVYAAKMTSKEMSGFKLAYVQSDEATFMLTDFDTHSTQGWFDYEVNKLVSLSASAFTAYFNSYWFNYKDVKRGYGGTDGESKMAMFDSRAFSVPLDDAPNVFIWRQRDWERNSIQMLARAHFSHKECDRKKIPDLHEMLHDKGVNWAKIDDQLKNGTFIESDGSLSFNKEVYETLSQRFGSIAGD